MAEQQELKLADKGSKKIIIIIIAVIVVVLLLIGATVFFMLSGSKGEVVETEIPQMQLIPGMPGPNAKEVHYIKFDTPFMIQLPTKPRERLLQVYVAVTTHSVENLDLARTHSLLIKSVLSETLSHVDPKLYNQMSGRLDVKNDCLLAVQDALRNETGQPIIDKILFTGFVMQ